MVRKELSIVIAMVIATAMPVAPCNPLSAINDRINPFPSEKLRSMYSNALEKCPRLADENVTGQVGSTLRRAKTPFESQFSKFQREDNEESVDGTIEILCKNRQSFIPCLNHYNEVLKDCWDLDEKNVEAGRSIKDDFFCKSDKRYSRKIFVSSYSPVLEGCIASFGNQTDYCVEETAKQTGIEITLNPNHTDFCR